ncbi:MAG: hypothetical protein QOI55_2002 [Actinomycetota bacterium]|nr:hypothetical protein [Actinomycetota bacterium]
MDVVGFVDDLMDRSRVTGALPGIRFVKSADAAKDADLAIVDLARYGEVVRALRAQSTTLRIVAFGPHVDEDAANRAQEDGADVVLPRSRFFRDPASAVA